MNAEEILAEALRSAALTRVQLDQLAAILRIQESDERAPTTVRDARQAAKAHVADSLVALELDAIRSAARIVDVGTGAGFPGLPLAVALPNAEITLLESQRRKCEYLEAVRATAAIDNARVLRARAEEWEGGARDSDVVVARAVGRQAGVLEYAAPLLRLGGTLVDWRGKRVRAEEDAASRAAHELGMRPVEVRRVEPWDGATDRHLHVFVKVADTPARFPRRAGMARKRPLGDLPARAKRPEVVDRPV